MQALIFSLTCENLRSTVRMSKAYCKTFLNKNKSSASFKSLYFTRAHQELTSCQRNWMQVWVLAKIFSVFPYAAANSNVSLEALNIHMNKFCFVIWKNLIVRVILQPMHRFEGPIKCPRCKKAFAKWLNTIGYSKTQHSIVIPRKKC